MTANGLTDLEQIAEYARRLKLERVRAFGGDPDERLSDLPGVALVIRGGRQVAQLWQGDGLEAPRFITYFACLCFDADEVCLVTDSLMRTVPKGTEESPEMGDYQREWEAGRRENLSEVLSVYRFTRDSSDLYGFPYRRVGRNLIWDTVAGGKRIRAATGMLGEFAKEGWRRSVEMKATMGPALDEAMVVLGVAEADKRYHMDRAAGKFASQMDGVGAVVVYTEEPDDDTPPAVFEGGVESEPG